MSDDHAADQVRTFLMKTPRRPWYTRAHWENKDGRSSERKDSRVDPQIVAAEEQPLLSDNITHSMI